MSAINYFQSDARIVTCGGLPLIGAMLQKAGIIDAFNKMPIALCHPENQILCSEVMVSAIATMCTGSSDFEGIHLYDDDKSFYADALGVKRFPSSERYRQRLDQMGAGESKGLSFHKELRDMNINLLKSNHAQFHTNPDGYVCLDIDVTPHDQSKTKKEGISRTYKGFDGYAPINAYLDQYFINTEFREGKQHSQCGTEPFLIETIDICNQLIGNARLLIRLDSGNDSVQNIGIIMERGHSFIIKRNPRKESKEDWLSLAEQNAPIHYTPREGKDVYIGSTWKEVTYTGSDGNKHTSTIRIVFEVIKRTIDKHGQCLLIPDIELHTFWDNTGYSDEKVIRLYQEHGTMEQYHSELKTDMDLERLPSGKFATNSLIYDISMLAYNLLRMLGNWVADMKDSTPMRRLASRRRLMTVIMHIIHAPARIVMHSRSMRIDLGCSNIWAPVLIQLHDRICAAA